MRLSAQVVMVLIYNARIMMTFNRKRPQSKNKYKIFSEQKDKYALDILHRSRI